MKHLVPCIALVISITAPVRASSMPERPSSTSRRSIAGAGQRQYAQPSADKIKTRVHARAMALADDRKQLAIVVVDSCMMPRDVAR